MSSTAALTAPAVDLAGFSKAQVDKARKLIAEGRITPTEWPDTYITVSSDGRTRYTTAPDACQCRGSMRGSRITPCYHQAAARLFAAASKAARWPRTQFSASTAQIFPTEPWFYVGCHRASWLWNGTLTVPAFVSHHALRCYKNLHPARVPWALDSGGFTEVSTYGEWRTTPRAYVEAVARYDSEIGRMEWAAPQDYMCEPWITEKTGLTVAEHQARTVANYVELTRLWPEYSDDSCPFMPVLQGWHPADYLACTERYADAGVDLEASPLVGLGSVCRRQATDQIGALIEQLSAKYALHGFGCKTLGIARYGHLLASADSMAWSFNARRNAVPARPRGSAQVVRQLPRIRRQVGAQPR